MAAGQGRLTVRLLLLDLESAWRGGQAQALLLLKGLRARGHPAELLSVRNAELAKRAQAENIPVHIASDRVRRLSAARLVRRLLNEQRFQIIHANEAHALTAAWLARVHRHVPLVAARRVAFPVSRNRLALARYRAAARILAVSHAVCEELLTARLDPRRVEIVRDGVEIPPRDSPDDRRRAGARWGIGVDDRVAAYVAPFSAEKGHELLIDAFAELHRTFPRCRLLLAGDGPLRAQIEQKVRAMNLMPAVLFLGFVREIESVYAACDVFLFPSLNEGLGTSLLSAMACALPVVAFSKGGITDALEDGRNGLLVKEAMPPAFAAAAARLLTDPQLARTLAEAARETIFARFSADRMVLDTLRVLEPLIDAGCGPARVSA